VKEWTRVAVLGTGGTWVFKPDQQHKHGRLFKGSLVVRGGNYALEQALKLLDARDDETSPKLRLLVPYSLWIEMLNHGTSKHIWVRVENWDKFLRNHGPMPAFAQPEHPHQEDGLV
jgi:hypothetical protein